MTTERKIAVGDLVECIYNGNYYSQFHGDGLYRVTDVFYRGMYLRLSLDKDDRGLGNGWVARYFRLAPEQSPINQGEYEDILADQNAYEALKED